MRASRVTRNTSETKIQLELCLDGSGKSEIKSGCGFLDHMLTAFARHGRFDIILSCDGDLEVDYHHTAEDIGIWSRKSFFRGAWRYEGNRQIRKHDFADG